jgi:hypothetical protein
MIKYKWRHIPFGVLTVKVLGVYDGMEVTIRSVYTFYTPSGIGPSGKEPRRTDLLVPGTTGLWTQRRR